MSPREGCCTHATFAFQSLPLVVIAAQLFCVTAPEYLVNHCFDPKPCMQDTPVHVLYYFRVLFVLQYAHYSLIPVICAVFQINPCIL